VSAPAQQPENAQPSHNSPSRHQHLAGNLIEVNHSWQMVPSSDDVRRQIGQSNRTIEWHETEVPGEWRFHENPADHSSSVMYRTTFDTPPLADHERLFVQSDGIFDQADLWLDGAYLGDQDDYFLRHHHDITDLVRLDNRHELLVEVNGGRHAGIWQPISLRRTGPAILRSVRVLCRDASSNSAHLLITAHIDASLACVGTIRTLADGVTVSSRGQSFSRGDNVVSWTVDLDNPPLWWPWSLNSQLNDSQPHAQQFVNINVEIDIDGETSDRHSCRTGIREVSMNNWVLTVNGERMYVKGAYLRQYEVDLGRIDPQVITHDVTLAREAGLDMLRLRRHVAHPSVYDAADELGMLIWQDMPERPNGKRGRKLAARWAKGIVDTLGYRPSIALWHHNALDRFSHRHLTRTDPTRPAVSHLSTAIPRQWKVHPRLAPLYESLGVIGDEFVSAITVAPNLARFVTHEETNIIHSHANLSDPKRLRATIEHLRRTKYSPTGGFCFVGLLDTSVLADDGVLNSDRQPKPTYFALVDACRAVIVTADLLPEVVIPGDNLSIDVHVVSDVQQNLTNARVSATVSWPGGRIQREWVGDVAADSCARVGNIRLDVPVTVGTLDVHLHVQAGDYTASNHYSTTVSA
jgi:beta-mannosidase